MSKLNREEILAIPDIQSEELFVPEWGGEVIVRGLSGAERDQLEASIVELKGKRSIVHLENIRAKLIQLSVVDEQGEHLFTEADLEALGKKSAAALDRIFSVAQRLSGLSEQDITDLAKN